jgi:hypothetical protein
MDSTLIVCLFALALLGSASTPRHGPQGNEKWPQEAAPLGRWKTVDDATGKVNSNHSA